MVLLETARLQGVISVFLQWVRVNPHGISCEFIKIGDYKMNAKIVVLFNHKGGVSKTTTTFHIAWQLASVGKRVLLVDGDPQCNLSGLVLADGFDAYYENEQTRANNIKDFVAPAFNGSPQPLSCIQPYQHSENNNLFLIPGHMDLSAYETNLSFALNSNNALSTLQNLPGSFYEMIRLACEERDIDYVFIDMNPGLSALNQTFFMICDGFIVPTNPDPFSIMALKTLKSVLPRWHRLADQLRPMFADAAYPLPEATMFFIGEIIQRYNIRNGKPASPYVDKIEEIKTTITRDLIPEFRRCGMLTPRFKQENHCLSMIQDFGALIQRANEANKPVFALKAEDLNSQGVVLDGFSAKVEAFKTTYAELAEKIIQGLS